MSYPLPPWERVRVRDFNATLGTLTPCPLPEGEGEGDTMLDIRFIREHPDLVQAGARKKRINIDIRHLLELDEQRRSLTHKVESLKALRNKTSKDIPTLQGEARQAAIAQMRQVAGERRA